MVKSAVPKNECPTELNVRYLGEPADGVNKFWPFS